MRIVVADDTTLFRKLISDILEKQRDIEVVKRCRDGYAAIEAIKMQKPDLMTLDLEMPEMDGLEVLETIKRERLKIGVIVVSAHTTTGGYKTIQALHKGAFDFITKPAGKSAEENQRILEQQLIPKIRAWEENRKSAKTADERSCTETSAKCLPSDFKPEIIAIGVSTGGPEALKTIISGLPGGYPYPVAIVQHMPPLFTSSLAEILDKNSELKVKEAADGDILQPGKVYLAPGDSQMRAVKRNGRMVIQLTDDPPEEGCKPSVNYFFRSLANSFPGKTAAVILTGMGQDGTVGLKRLKRHGCLAIVQDKRSSVVYGMPGAAIAAGLADRVLPVDQIASALNELA